MASYFRIISFATCLALATVLAGCSAIPRDGGIATHTVDRVTTTTEIPEHTTKDGRSVPAAKVTVEKVQTSTIIKQPQNPTPGTGMSIDDNGKLDVKLGGSKEPDVAEGPTPTETSLGWLVIVAGIVALAGIPVAIWVNMKWGLMLSVAGVVGVVVFVAVQAATGFLGIILTIVVAAGLIYAAITYTKWRKKDKALKQTKKAIDNVKTKDPTTWEKIKPELESEQDADVKKEISKIKT